MSHITPESVKAVQDERLVQAAQYHLTYQFPAERGGSRVLHSGVLMVRYLLRRLRALTARSAPHPDRAT